VRLVQQPCSDNTNWTCACAVVVRSGDDIIAVDNCADSNVTNVHLYLNRQLTPGTQVSRFGDGNAGSKYRVALPSGTYIDVRVSHRRNHLSTIIYASTADDFEASQGLCSSHSNNTDNNIPDLSEARNTTIDTQSQTEETVNVSQTSLNSFIALWRRSSSYLNGICPSDKELPFMPANFCQCDMTTAPKCGRFQDVELCGLAAGDISTVYSGIDITDKLILSASTPVGCCQPSPELSHSLDVSFVPQTLSWPTGNRNLTEEEVRNSCRQILNESSVMAACSNVSNKLNIQDIIYSCVRDIQLTEDTESMQDYIDDLLWRCVHVVSSETHRWRLATAGHLEAEDPGLCFNACSQHGTCVKGLCECTSGFGSADCSLDLSIAPEIMSIVGGWSCDLASGDDCGSVQLLGSGFLDTTNLTCHLTNNNTERKHNAVFINSNHIVCNVTLTSSAEIQFSNDGVTVGNKLPRILYDGSCQTCAGGVCQKKNNICVINNKCYSCGSVFEDDPRSFCQPDNSTDLWSLIPEEKVFTKRLKLQSLNQSELITNFGSAAVESNVQLVTGYGGDKSLLLATANQSVTFSKMTLSLLDTDSCSLGFTLRFNIKFSHLCDGASVFSTWGYDNSGSGPALSVCDGSAFVHVRTQDKQWTLKVGQVEINRLVQVDVSWSASLGLTVSWANYTYTTRLYSVLQKPARPMQDFIIGSTVSTSCYAGFVLGGLEIFSAPKPVLAVLEVITDLPTLPSEPVISVEYKQDRNTTMFICLFKSLSRGDVQYEVVWKVDEQLVRQTVLASLEFQDIMNETEYGQGMFGSQISCAVTACYVYNCPELRGSTFTATFDVTVKVIETELTVTEGLGTSFIHVTSSVPAYLLCSQRQMLDYSSILEASVTVGQFSGKQLCPNGRSLRQLVIGGDNGRQDRGQEGYRCGQLLNSAMWSQGLSVPVQATVDSVQDGNVTGDISVTVSVNCAGVTKELFSQTVKVTVIDKDKRSMCQSVNDPHFRTFDGILFNNFKEGLFTLYEHTTLPYTVQAFYRKCNRNIASCNCAIAVKVEDDVVLIDRCGPHVTTKPRSLTVQMIRNGGINPGLRIQQRDDGNQYQIILPTGTIIIVENGRSFSRDEPRFLNVWISASSVDFGHTRGLCGSFDGDASNDLVVNGTNLKISGRQQKKFAEYWRVAANESLYGGYCPHDDDDDEDAQATAAVFCDCPRGANLSCGSDHYIIDCRRNTSEQIKDVTLELFSQSHQPKQCFDDLTEVDVFEFDMNYTYDSDDTKWPTPSGLDKDKVYSLCSGAVINSSLAAAGCNQTLQINIDAAIEFCVTDIMMTDDIHWIDNMVSNIRVQCLTQLSFDLTEVNVNICPSDCSNRGVCSGFSCSCRDPYLGFDCSIDWTKPPALTGILGGNICDIQLDDGGCKKITLTGYPFAKGHLKCHLQKLEVSRTSIKINTAIQQVTVDAVVIDLETATCMVPSADSWAVSVSNNVSFVSQVQFYIIFDSNRETCTLTGCVPRDDVCVINGLYYENGASANGSLVCNTATNKTSWTTISIKDIIKLIFRYVFLRIEGSMLVTPAFNFYVVGTPKLIPGPVAGNAVRLNGVDQYLSLINLTGSCLGDISLCTYGLTLKFSLAIYNFRNRMYILSCGADTSLTSGVSIWWQGNKLNARVRTLNKEWTVSAPYRQSRNINTFVNVELSWSIDQGLALFLDGNQADYARKFTQKSNKVMPAGICYFGRPFGFESYSSIAMSDLTIVYAYNTIVKKFNISV
ncbi:unnamed protein product, partial [Candidula unifasciata]